MSLVTAQTVKTHTVITDTDHANTAANFGPQAEERMRDVLTGDADPSWQRRLNDWIRPFNLPVEQDRGDIYDDIVDQNDPWVQADKDRLEKAETVYAFAEALPSLNINISTDGGLVDSTGFEQSRTNYRSESSLSELQSHLKSGAIRLVRGILSRHDRDDPEPVYHL